MGDIKEWTRLGVVPQLYQAPQEVAAERREAPIVARQARTAQQVRGPVDRLIDPDAATEEAIQALQVRRLTNQEVKPFDTDNRPGEIVGVQLPAGMVFGTGQDSTWKLGLDASQELHEREPRDGIAGPIRRRPKTSDDRRRSRLQVAGNLPDSAHHFRIIGRVELRRLAHVLKGPIHVQVDEARLGRLVTELGSDPRYATGSRRFPLPISDAEAMAIAEGFSDECDVGTRERERLAERQGLRIHCHPGCSSCCGVLVMAFRPETLRIAEYLRAPEQTAARERFLAQFATWRAAVGDLPERVAARFASGDQKGYETLLTEHFRKRILCAFNDEGRCTVYPVRPLGCRDTHALDTDAHCTVDPPDGKPPAALGFVPLENLLRDARRILRATHNATTTRRHEQTSICVAVHTHLTKR